MAKKNNVVASVGEIKQIKLRKAVEIDSDDIWNWRNDPLTKKNSGDPRAVTRETHNIWFKQALENPDSFLFIGVIENKYKLGICRFELCDGEVEISLNLNPEFRNKNLSTPFLKIALKQFLKNSNVSIVAKIKPTNVASVRSFKAAGFSVADAENEFTYLRYYGEQQDSIEKLKLIDEIEKIRSKNNINWMNLLRLSFKVAPNQAKLIFRQINHEDAYISELLGKLSE